MRTQKTVEIFALTILLMSIESINTIDTQEQERHSVTGIPDEIHFVRDYDVQ
jgi:hypothetical protein